MTIETRRAWDGGFNFDFDTDGGDFAPVVVEPPATLVAPVDIDIVAFAIDSVTSDGTDLKPNDRKVRRNRPRHRILVGGKDVTYFRGVQTPLPQYSLQSPLLYGSGMLTFPQIHAVFDRPSQGDLTWLKKDARVKIQRVDSDGTVVDHDFIGTIGDYRHDGRTFSCLLEGEAVGPCSSIYRPMPIFPQVIDVGSMVMRQLQNKVHLPTANEPTTGVSMMESGGGWTLDWLSDTLAKSDMRDGTQWTVMPTNSGKYKMQQKDLDTIGATVYIDGSRIVESLRRDFSQEINRAWAQGINPDGMRERFAIFPGLVTADRAYPGSPLSPGDSGDDVTAIIWRLYTLNYLDDFDVEWTTDPNDPVTEAVEDIQDDADISAIAGHVDAATWNAIFRGDSLSLRRATMRPAALKSFTEVYLYDATGNVLGKNPRHDRTKRIRDEFFDMGAGWTRRQMKKWAKRKLRDPDVPNWVGTITINTGAVIDGEHNPGDPLTTADIRNAQGLTPGENLWLANWHGGTLVHISGVNISPGPPGAPPVVELAVDSQARDTMPVWEVIRRNKQSARSPGRVWRAEHRRSGVSDDSSAFYDGGPFGKTPPVDCPANTWTVLEIVAGRSGTLQRIDIQTSNAEALFGFAIFGAFVDEDWCVRNMGNPFAKGYPKNLRKNEKNWRDDKWLVDVWGQKDQPCGYWPQILDPNAFDVVSDTGTADSATDTIHIDTHGYHNGQKVYFSTGSVPAGLTADNDYYVIKATTNTFKVSATEGGSPMDITADRSGVTVSIHVADTPPVTGEYRTDAGIPYYCHGKPVLYLPIYVDRDTTVQGGRILKLLLDDSAS